MDAITPVDVQPLPGLPGADEAVAWWLDRMAATGGNAAEKLVFFWHGHWATSVRKVKFPLVMLGQQQTMHALGPGDFGFVPAGLPHAYRVERASRMLGVVSGGFERFFQHMGAPTDVPGEHPAFVPAPPRMQAAAQAHRMQFLRDVDWPDA